MRNKDEIIKTLLAKRGIVKDEEVTEYLSLLPQKTYDPFLMLGMREAVDVICESIDNKEKICVYGDYDCDGVTSVCLLTAVLEEIATERQISYYIPSRFSEGYGLNKGALKKLKDDGISLVITVDCGSVSYDEVEYAKEIGLKIIVTDHHNIDDRKADCILLNPKQEECPYPFDGLCGCGVAYKLAQALQRHIGFDRSVIIRILDFVGVATIGDIVPLVDENRTITKYGLNEIRRGNRAGLRILSETISLKTEEISSTNIAFGIVPHINACGRIEDAKLAVEMLKSSKEKEIRDKANKIAYLNSKRKSRQDDAFKRCMDIVNKDQKDADFKVIKADVHEGVAGIVAGKLKDEFNRPCIIVTESDGKLKGTGRSIPEVNIYELLKKNEELFIRFGGHKSACGFLMEAKNLEVLQKSLQKDLSDLKKKNKGIFDVEVAYDMELEIGEVSIELAREIQLMEPFGEGNNSPSFRLNDVNVEFRRSMGKNYEHIKFLAHGDGIAVECISFGDGNEIYRKFFNNGKKNLTVDLIGNLDINTFNGNSKVQILVNAVIDKRGEN